MNQLVKTNATAAGTRRIDLSDTGSATTTGATITNVATIAAPPGAMASKAIENAVFGHLQALRALGRTEAKASEIAQALVLSQAAVVRALTSLRRKGVKPIE